MNSTCFNRDPVLVNWIFGKTYKSLTAFLFKTLDIERVKPRCFMIFLCESEESTWICVDPDVTLWNETMKYRATRHVESSFVLYISPNGEGVPYKPASFLTFYDISWSSFLTFLWLNTESIHPYQSLRFFWFADLVICLAKTHCKAFARELGTDGLELGNLGIWKNSGDLGWTSVLIPDI